ncbi:Ribonuclease H-like domain [Venturia nashicola]|uniref:RNA exonuclease 4 n=1 Tax=Venturia nashicola TaxID=86259 RepID=A0A4Z1PJ72_9PEZI|nr:Ribonuclease H-like domain [Venturia nashicola]
MPGIVTMAPGNTTELSSNWKRLQETLAKEKKAAPPKDKDSSKRENGIPQSLKRKRANEPERKPAVKRSKIETPGQRRNKIRMARSSEPNTLRKSKSTPHLKPTNPSASEDEDEDEEQDRPSSSNGVHVTSSDEAHTNEGVSPTNLAGKYIALDCEMVGFGPTPNDDSQLARVSIVNYHGHQIYDSFVLPQVPVTDYRTHITGITATTLKEARPFKEVQSDVATFLNGRVLVGHAIKNDLAVLQMTHPKRDIRDTSRHAAFREVSQGRTPSLKKLASLLLGMEIQQGHHSSVEDARTTMLLFQKHKEAFDSEHVKTWGRPMKMGTAEVDGEEAGRKRKKKKGRK